MKLFVTLFCTVTLAVLLTGCATPPHEIQADPQVAVAQAKALEACRQWQTAEQDRKWNEVGSMPDSHKAFAIMHFDTLATIRAVTGADEDVCHQGTNVYDAMIAYYKHHAEEVGDGLDLVKVGMWAVTAGIISNNIFDAVSGTEINVQSGGDASLSDVANTKTITQIQAGGQSTGDNNLGEPGQSVAEPEEGGDYLGIPGCSGEESYLAGRCAEGPELPVEEIEVE